MINRGDFKVYTLTAMTSYPTEKTSSTLEVDLNSSANETASEWFSRVSDELNKCTASSRGSNFPASEKDLEEIRAALLPIYRKAAVTYNKVISEHRAYRDLIFALSTQISLFGSANSYPPPVYSADSDDGGLRDLVGILKAQFEALFPCKNVDELSQREKTVWEPANVLSRHIRDDYCGRVKALFRQLLELHLSYSETSNFREEWGIPSPMDCPPASSFGDQNGLNIHVFAQRKRIFAVINTIQGHSIAYQCRVFDLECQISVVGGTLDARTRTPLPRGVDKESGKLVKMLQCEADSLKPSMEPSTIDRRVSDIICKCEGLFKPIAERFSTHVHNLSHQLLVSFFDYLYPEDTDTYSEIPTSSKVVFDPTWVSILSAAPHAR